MDSINHCIETRMNEDLAIRLNEEDLAGIDPTFAKKYYNLKNKHKIKTKFLVLEGKEFKRETAIEVKTLPKEYSSPTNMFIYGHKVAIWLWPRAPAIILIENKETADSYRKQFELMWKQANKLK